MTPQKGTNKQGVELKTSEEKKRWKALFKLPSQPSRYPSLLAIRGLGIERCFYHLLDASGLRQLFTQKFDSYHNLTVEFLSTLQVEREDVDITSINFRLRNGEHTLTLAQFNTIFNFHGEADGTVDDEPEEYDEHALWNAITLQENPDVGYRPANAKNNEARNPVLRYFLVYLPFAHKEPGSCQSNELFILWGALFV